MKRLTETPEYRTGVNAERHVEAWLCRHRYSVVRVRHGGDVAPTLQSWHGRVVLPDLQALTPDSRLVWVDVKWKDTVGEWRNGNSRTTGIDRTSWQEYGAVERLTGRPVYLVFCHRTQDEVRVARATEDYIPGSGTGKRMVYWRYDRLKLLATYAQVMATTPEPRLQLDMPLFTPGTVQSALPGLEAA